MTWLEVVLAVVTALATATMAWFSLETHTLAKRIQVEADQRADGRARAYRTQAAYRLLMAEGVFRGALTDARGVLIVANQDSRTRIDKLEVFEAFPEGGVADAVFRALVMCETTFEQIRSLATTLRTYHGPAFWFKPLTVHPEFLKQVQKLATNALVVIEEAQTRAGLRSAAEREEWIRGNLAGDGLFKTGSGVSDAGGASGDPGTG